MIERRAFVRSSSLGVGDGLGGAGIEISSRVVFAMDKAQIKSNSDEILAVRKLEIARNFNSPLSHGQYSN